jgi:hypothetical protein
MVKPFKLKFFIRKTSLLVKNTKEIGVNIKLNLLSKAINTSALFSTIKMLHRNGIINIIVEYKTVEKFDF